jgi:hypothetical protein
MALSTTSMPWLLRETPSGLRVTDGATGFSSEDSSDPSSPSSGTLVSSAAGSAASTSAIAAAVLCASPPLTVCASVVGQLGATAALRDSFTRTSSELVLPAASVAVTTTERGPLPQTASS